MEITIKIDSSQKPQINIEGDAEKVLKERLNEEDYKFMWDAMDNLYFKRRKMEVSEKEEFMSHMLGLFERFHNEMEIRGFPKFKHWEDEVDEMHRKSDLDDIIDIL